MAPDAQLCGSADHGAAPVIAMVVLSILVSYILLSNVMLLGPVYNHVNKLYMALLMGTTMGAVAALSMPMSPKTRVVLLLASGVASLLLVVVIRRQTLVTQRQFALGMIEHHQMALLMSRRVLERTDNASVRQLARSILTTQQSEIDQMTQWVRHGFPRADQDGSDASELRQTEYY